jgi:hypothetical protein
LCFPFFLDDLDAGLLLRLMLLVLLMMMLLLLQMAMIMMLITMHKHHEADRFPLHSLTIKEELRARISYLLYDVVCS